MSDAEMRRLEREARQQDHEAGRALRAARGRLREPRPAPSRPATPPPRQRRGWPGDEPGTYVWHGKVYREVRARLLWSLGHYDGAMSGIAIHDGRACYAVCHQSPFARTTRWFWLYPLSDEEFRRETLYQRMFRHYYGAHCDYEDDGLTRRTRAPEPAWTPGPARSLADRAAAVLARLLGHGRGRAEPLRPTYSALERRAGIEASDRVGYQDREALGYFCRRPGATAR